MTVRILFSFSKKRAIEPLWAFSTHRVDMSHKKGPLIELAIDT